METFNPEYNTGHTAAICGGHPHRSAMAMLLDASKSQENDPFYHIVWKDLHITILFKAS